MSKKYKEERAKRKAEAEKKPTVGFTESSRYQMPLPTSRMEFGTKILATLKDEMGVWRAVVEGTVVIELTGEVVWRSVVPVFPDGSVVRELLWVSEFIGELTPLMQGMDRVVPKKVKQIPLEDVMMAEREYVRNMVRGRTPAAIGRAYREAKAEKVECLVTLYRVVGRWLKREHAYLFVKREEQAQEAEARN